MKIDYSMILADLIILLFGMLIMVGCTLIIYIVASIGAFIEGWFYEGY
jgi:hypothetical protein